jgi:hypothetical protein
MAYIVVNHFVYIKIVFHTIFIVFHYFFKLQISNEMKHKPMEQINHTSLRLAIPIIFY